MTQSRSDLFNKTNPVASRHRLRAGEGAKQELGSFAISSQKLFIKLDIRKLLSEIGRLG